LSFRGRISKLRAVSPSRLCVVACASLALLVSCKSRDGGGSGAAAKGSTAGSDAARVVLPPDVDASKITVTVHRAKPLPVAIERYTVALDEHFTVVRLVEVGPETPTETCARLTLAIPAGDLPAGTRMEDLRAVGVGKLVAPEDLEVTAHGEQLTISLQHLAHVLVVVPAPNITLLGTPARILLGTTRVMAQDACAEWLTPTSPRIAAIAKDPAAFAVGADGAITLTPKLGMQVVDAAGELSKPDEVLARGGGDTANTSLVLGSLFLARGNIVGLASGFVTIPRGDQTYKGLAQWAMTIIDGKRYVVDAFDPLQPRLVPLDEATTDYKLGGSRYCARSPDGSKIDRRVWAADQGSPPSGADTPSIRLTKPTQ
jgi:hypothetical protein